jgi:hypothetical protein
LKTAPTNATQLNNPDYPEDKDSDDYSNPSDESIDEEDNSSIIVLTEKE